MAVPCLHVHPPLHPPGHLQHPHLHGDQESHKEKDKTHQVDIFLHINLSHPAGQEPEEGDRPGHDALLCCGHLLHLPHTRTGGQHTRGIMLHNLFKL